MSYSTTNPPQLLMPGMGGGPGLWVYKSTHTSTELAATGFITNGHALGMKVADLVIGVGSTNGVPVVLGAVTVTASSAATLALSTV